MEVCFVPLVQASITFKTTSRNEIKFNLLENGDVQKSYIISEDENSNYEMRTVNLYVYEDIKYDQMELTGLFEETNQLIIDNI